MCEGQYGKGNKMKRSREEGREKGREEGREGGKGGREGQTYLAASSSHPSAALATEHI